MGKKQHGGDSNQFQQRHQNKRAYRKQGHCNRSAFFTQKHEEHWHKGPPKTFQSADASLSLAVEALLKKDPRMLPFAAALIGLQGTRCSDVGLATSSTSFCQSM